MNDITLAIIFAAKKHDGQTRRNKTPYIYHPIRVADKLKQDGWSDEYQIVAILHDVLEDTNTSKHELQAMFGEEIAYAVDLLTRRQHMPENLYVSNILSNQMATMVKEADKIDNISESIINIQTDDDYWFACRYIEKAQTYYKGRFSKDLDKVIDDAIAKLEDKKLGRKQTLPDFSDKRMQFFEIWDSYCCTLHLDDCQIGVESDCWVYDENTGSWNPGKLDIIENFDEISLINIDKNALPKLKLVH